MKILYVTTISDTMYFFKETFKILKDNGYQVDLMCSPEREFDLEIKNNVNKIFYLPFNRNPLSLKNILAIINLKSEFLSEYDIIHTHTPIASAIVRIVTKSNNIIYTAHGFHFYKGSRLKNWLLYYPVEKLLSYKTDTLITINQEDYDFAVKNLNARNIFYIPGVGINLTKFNNLTYNNESSYKKIVHNKENNIILLSIGELNKNKNHEIVIKALSKIENRNWMYYIAGEGPLREYLNDLIKSLSLENNIKLLGYRHDILELLNDCDLYIHPSHREGLSVAIMEAMASGKFCLVSDIRGNRDLIDNSGGMLFNQKSVTDTKNKLELSFMMANKSNINEHNIMKIKKFGNTNVNSLLLGIYSKYRRR